MQVRFRKVREGAIVPSYATPGSVGLDLHALESGYARCELPELALVKIPTGIAIELPDGFEAQVRGRSSLTAKGFLVQLGTIDSDYRGEIWVTATTQLEHVIEPGDRIAQLVIAPVARVTLVEAAELSETVRGAGGFGHTGR